MSREVKLTMSLVDAVSGPGRAAAASLRGLQAAATSLKNVSVAGLGAAFREMGEGARRVQRASAAMAPAGAAIGLGLAKGASSVYEIEKSLNVSVAAGNLDLAQRNEFMAEAVRLNAEFAATSGEIIQAGNKLLRAGMSYDQMMGSLPGVLSTAQAMDVPMEDASRAIVDSMVSMRMAMHDTQSTMQSSIRIADLYAHAVNATTGELEDFALSSRYFNPVAASMGMSPEEAMALQIALAKNGIKGSSAGTGLRSAPVSIADPSKKARQAFARLGIDPADFTGERAGDASGASVAAALEAAGFSAEGIEDAIDNVLSDPAMRAAPARAAIAILDTIGEEIGVATAEDRALVSDAIQRAIMSGVKEVDLVGALRALRESGAGIADFTAIFGRNHASKMMALDPAIFDAAIADIEANAAGTSKRMREAMMAGIVGDVAEADAAFEALFVNIGRAGVLADASRAIAGLAEAVSDLAAANPKLLRLATYSAAAVAVLPALGFAAMGVGAALSLLVSPLALATVGIGALVALNWSSVVGGFRAFSQGLRNNLSPTTLKALRDARDAVAGWLGSFGRGGVELRRVGLELGRLAAGGITAIVQTAPGLRNVGAAFGPLATAARSFAVDKLLALREAGEIVADFAAKAGPAMSPALASAISLVGGSLDVLGRGAGAVGRVSSGALEGILSFARGVVGGIDTEALAEIGRGLSGLFDTLGAALPNLSAAFDKVDLSFARFAEEAGGAVGRGISAVITALANGREGLSNAWEGVKGIFTQIGGYTPSFGGIVSAVTSFVGTIVTAAENLAGAVRRMLEAVNLMPRGGAGAPAVSAWSGDGVPVGGGNGTRPSSSAFNGDGVPVGGGAGTGPRDGGGRSTGGLVRDGFRYEVNERGQEFITLRGVSGYITPAHRLPEAVDDDTRNALWRPIMPAPIDVQAIVASLARPYDLPQPSLGRDVRALPKQLASAPQAEPFDLSSLARSVGGADRDRGRRPVQISISGNSFHGVSRADAKGFADELGRQLSRSPQVAMD